MQFLLRKNDVSSEKFEKYERLDKYLNNCDFTKELSVDFPISDAIKRLLELANQAIGQNNQMDLVKSFDMIIRQLVSMTSVRQMLLLIDEQTNQMKDITAHTEELSSTADQIAIAATNSAAFVNNSTATADSGGQKIQEAIAFMNNSLSEFIAVSSQVQEVFNSMKEIDQVVTAIAGIADQSNLLALNAAIEAARAGENGRGFAVVADEVRKLADHTKDSVLYIRKKIDELGNDSEKTESNLTTLTQNMQSGMGIMGEAADAIRLILNNFKDISQDIQEIAAGSQEQSASLQESTGIAENVAKNAIRVQELAQDTGKSVYEISKSLQRVRKTMHKDSNLDVYQKLEMAKSGHLIPAWKVYNTIVGFENLKESDVVTHTDCNFGKWLQSPAGAVCRSLPSFKDLEDSHQRLHELSREAIANHERGNLDKTEQILDEMSLNAEKFVNLLSVLQTELERS
ncbi:methyl-accepting chemotaxis protein [Desulfosporosinus sp. FKA]|uniref:methyl-accepting chemotaxis protein n=1 Tax=Desulfosporosinus sp. FKA TaxID=1969834 RepID=UPI000B49B9DC|nr:methyl-accepting chemotaxis protein [Desulfosporosinus sp. FKA]